MPEAGRPDDDDPRRGAGRSRRQDSGGRPGRFAPRPSSRFGTGGNRRFSGARDGAPGRPEARGDRNFGSRPVRRDGDERPGSSGSGNRADRPRPGAGGGSYGQNDGRRNGGRSSDGGRPAGPRRDGDYRSRNSEDRRPSGAGSDRQYRGNADRPYRNRDDRPAGGNTDRPYRNRDDRPAGGNTGRPYRGNTDRPYRGRSSEDRPGRPDNTGRPYRGNTDRPYRNRDDRPARPNDTDRPYRGNTDRPYRGRDDRPNSGDRPYRGRDDRPYKKPDDRPYRKPDDRRSPSNRGGAGAAGGGRDQPRRPAPPRERGDNRDWAAGGPLSRPTGRDRRDDRQERPGPPVNRNWGGVARRGAREVTDPGERASASDLWREAVARSEEAKGGKGPWEPEEVWVLDPEDEEPPAAQATRPTPGVRTDRDLATGSDGAPSPGGHRKKLPRPVVDELTRTAGTERGAKLANRIADATYAYEKERYQDARRTLRGLAEEIPESAVVRELYGLVLYRSGQWAAAAKQLEAFKELSGSYDQHPVLADCYRALHRWIDAEAVWEDLREASPSGDLVAEGRIVAAGVKADRGDLAGAIVMLEKAARKVAKPQDRHLRQWYALADLYERAGDVPKARDLFNRVASVDPEAFDVRSRLRALR